MTVTSTAFQNNALIPSKYTCDGKNYNPPLTFSQVPSNAQSLVLIIEDPDAPSKVFTHWVVYNMPSSTLQILENQVPQNSSQGKTDFGNIGYGGPCPPSGTHRYFFKLYALDTTFNLPEGITKEKVEEAVNGHIIESAEIVGLYKRQ